MYARITPYKMKASAREAAMEKMAEMKEQILALPGMQRFTSAMNEDGRGYIVAIVSDRATSDANRDKVRALWSNFADYLEEMPTPEGYEVVADWKP